jgi:hypothetical protein
MTDAGSPTQAQAKRFLELCQGARERKEMLLVHCWQGRKRTWCMARYALAHFTLPIPTAPVATTHWIDAFLRGANHEETMLCLLATALDLQRTAENLGALFTEPNAFDKDHPLGAELLQRWDALTDQTLLCACNGDRELLLRIKEKAQEKSFQEWRNVWEGGPSGLMHIPEESNDSQDAPAPLPEKRSAPNDAPAKRIKTKE